MTKVSQAILDKLHFYADNKRNTKSGNENPDIIESEREQKENKQRRMREFKAKLDAEAKRMAKNSEYLIKKDLKNTKKSFKKGVKKLQNSNKAYKPKVSKQYQQGQLLSDYFGSFDSDFSTINRESALDYDVLYGGRLQW